MIKQTNDLVKSTKNRTSIKFIFHLYIQFVNRLLFENLVEQLDVVGTKKETVKLKLFKVEF